MARTLRNAKNRIKEMPTIDEIQDGRSPNERFGKSGHYLVG
jgi:hypothetical protein